jgi:Flp pilus assembly protein TadD
MMPERDETTSGRGYDDARMPTRLPALRRLAPIALVLLAVGAYANALGGAFHFDDLHAVAENPSIRSLHNLGRFFTDGRMFTVLPQDQEYRPLVLVSYALTARFFGVEARPFLAVNLAIHAACVWLLFVLVARVRAVLGRPGDTDRDGVDGVALLAAAIFAVHPLFSECVNYVHARSESLSTAFSLAALLAYLRAREAPEGGRSDLWQIVAALALFAGLMAKVVAGVVPILAIAIELAAAERQPLKRVVTRLAVMSFAVIAFSLIYVKLSSPFAVASRSSFTRVQYLFSELPALFHYLRLFVVPTGQSIDPDYPAAGSFFEARVMTAALLLLAVAIAAAAGLWTRRGAGAALAVAWFFICLGPTSSLFPLGEIVNEHRPYMAAMALCAVAAEALIFGLPWAFELEGAAAGRARLAAAMALLAALTTATVRRNRVWRSDLELWRDVVAGAPTSARAHGNYGHDLLGAGDMLGAETHLRESLRLAPTYPYALLMLGSWIFSTGDSGAAVPYLDRATMIDPNLFWAHHLRGLAAEALHEPPDRVAGYFAHVVALSPTFPDGHYHLAVSLDALGRVTESLASARRAVELRGNYDDRFELAYELLRSNDVAAATPLLTQLAAERPGDARVRNNLEVARRGR